MLKELQKRAQQLKNRINLTDDTTKKGLRSAQRIINYLRDAQINLSQIEQFFIKESIKYNYSYLLLDTVVVNAKKKEDRILISFYTRDEANLFKKENKNCGEIWDDLSQTEQPYHLYQY